MQRIFDYLRARLFDLRKKRAIKQARRDAATYGKKFIVIVWDKRPVCVSMQAVKTLIRQRRLVGVTPEKIQQQAIFVAFPPSNFRANESNAAHVQALPNAAENHAKRKNFRPCS